MSELVTALPKRAQQSDAAPTVFAGTFPLRAHTAMWEE